MKSNSLEMQQLVVGREGHALTPPIDMSIQPGELLAITGNNGSGKSTFLKTLARLLPPLRGKILIQGCWEATAPLVYLGHKRGLNTDMTVYDNVALWARLRGHPELTAVALRYFALDDVAASPLRSLSAGWQQRVALTRLITMPAPLWILDEPTENLDSYGLSLIHTLIETRLQQAGIVMLATHQSVHGKNAKTINISNLK